MKAHNCERIMKIIRVHIELELPKVKVPVVCLVTEGVSPPRDGHWLIRESRGFN